MGIYVYRALIRRIKSITYTQLLSVLKKFILQENNFFLMVVLVEKSVESA